MFELSLRFLANPYDCWQIGGPDARNLVMRLAFARPLSYSRETGCLNTEKSSVFSMLDGLKGAKNEVVPQEGLEPPTHALRMHCSTS